MTWLEEQIKKAYSKNYKITFTTSDLGQLPKVFCDVPMPTVKPPKNKEDSAMNMTPNRCGDCMWIQSIDKESKCFYYPPVVVFVDEGPTFERLRSFRSSVKKFDKACSKFKRAEKHNMDFDDERLK